MIGRSARAIGLWALLILLGACVLPYEGAFNPAHFARTQTAVESRAAGRIGLLVTPPVQGLVYAGDTQASGGVHMPIGRIVEQAVLTALGDGLRGGVERVQQVPPADAGFDATLVIEAVRADHHRRLAWLIPLPPPALVLGDWYHYAQLSFDVSLLDAQGRTVWTRSYDSGRELWKPLPSARRETLPEGYVRMAHEAAWRLSQQAVTDLRDWLAVERRKPREL